MTTYIVLTKGKFEQQIPFERTQLQQDRSPEDGLAAFLISPRYPWLPYTNSLGERAWVNLSLFRKVEIKNA